MFEDIKVGDKVMVKVAVKDGMFERSPRFFTVAMNVDRTTRTMFFCGEDGFKKATGNIHSSVRDCRALKYDKSLDQSVEMEEYKALLMLRRKAKMVADSAVSKISEYNHEELKSLIKFVREL